MKYSSHFFLPSNIYTQAIIDWTRYIGAFLGLCASICACAKPLYLSDFDTGAQVLSINGRVSLDLPEDNKLSTQAQLRIRTDSIIWGTFSILGIEGLRIQATPAQVKAVVRFPKKNFHVLSYEQLKQFTGVAMKYAWFENMLLARPLLPIKSYILSKKENKKKYYTHTINDTLSIALTLHKGRLLSQSLHYQNNSQALVHYTYEAKHTHPLPQFIKFQFTDTQQSIRATIDLKYKRIQFIDAKNATFPFKEPE